MIVSLRELKARLTKLKKEVGELTTKQVSRRAIRDEAEAIASSWVEQHRSPLEHKYRLDAAVISETSELMKKLHVLSRPNNQKSSYTRVLNQILKNFDDKFVLPLQQSGGEVAHLPQLRVLLSGVSNDDTSEYLTEAIECAEAGFLKAAVVMGWCAAIDWMQKRVMLEGFATFNTASSALKARQTGKFKRWNKQFNVTTLSDLQTVFDTDLIVVLEGMGNLDGNQAQRLETCFQYRNHSAHPGKAPIEEPHVISFFTDITKIIFENEKFKLS